MNYVLNEEKMFCDITDGIAIVINSETGIYYGMNGLGTAVFENILNGASTENIIATLKKLPKVPTNIETNFQAFLQALLDKELIIIGNAGDKEVKIEEKVATDSNYAIEIKEYNDAQELLLADPIHEVKEETGWQPDKDALNPDKEDVTKRESKME